MRKTKVVAKKPVPVKISLKNGLVQCEPFCPHVHRGQAIEWTYFKKFPFAIHLGYDSPFEIVHYQMSGQNHIRLVIAKDIPLGWYKYSIALFDGRKVWIEDPEFIVRPSK